MDKNFCVVGGGYWGKNHIKTFYELGALGAIVEENKDLLDSFSKYNNVLLYNNLDDAILNNQLTGFTVATPAETHYKIAKKIILSGKNVLIEKPFALNIKDAEDLVFLSKSNKVTLMVGHLMLFHPAIKKIKKLINDKAIGKLRYIYSNRLNFGKIRTFEDVFWSLAPHDISIFQYIIKSFPVSINIFGNSFIQKGISDSTITHLEYPDNIHCHIYNSWIHPYKEHRLVVIGSEGMITFDDSSEKKLLSLFLKKFDTKNNVPFEVNGNKKNISYTNKSPLTEELSYFIKNQYKTKSNKLNGKDALDVTRIMVEASERLRNR